MRPSPPAPPRSGPTAWDADGRSSACTPRTGAGWSGSRRCWSATSRPRRSSRTRSSRCTAAGAGAEPDKALAYLRQRRQRLPFRPAEQRRRRARRARPAAPTMDGADASVMPGPARPSWPRCGGCPPGSARCWCCATARPVRGRDRRRPRHRRGAVKSHASRGAAALDALDDPGGPVMRPSDTTRARPELRELLRDAHRHRARRPARSSSRPRRRAPAPRPSLLARPAWCSPPRWPRPCLRRHRCPATTTARRPAGRHRPDEPRSPP